MAANIRTYNAIVVDDNTIDRLTTIAHIRQFPFLQLIGEYSSPTECLEKADFSEIQVLFLDIDMPGMTGLELRSKIGLQQVCIFITSYPDYAVESFQQAALDFLVKPFEKSRFAVSMQRLQDYLEIKEKATLFECSLGADTIFIKEGHEQVKIKLQDIIYLEALKDYTRIVTAYKKYHVLSLLGDLLQEPAFKSFVRIHRSYAVQKNYIDRISAREVQLGSISLPLGRSFKPSIDNLQLNNQQ